MDRGAWWAIVHGGHKELDMSEWLNTHMASCSDEHTLAFSLCCHLLLVDEATDRLCPQHWRQPNLSHFIILVKAGISSLVVWIQFCQKYCFHNKNCILLRIYAPWCIFLLAAPQKFNNSFHTSFFKNLVVHCCSVTKPCPTFCDPMGWSTPGFPVLHYLPCSNLRALSQWCYLAISSSAALFFSCPQSFPASGSFSVSHLFASSGQSIGASASAWVLPVNIQGWFPLGWTGLFSLLSKGLSFLKIILCICLFLAVPGLHCRAGFTLVASSRSFSLGALRGLLIVVASLIAEHGL